MVFKTIGILNEETHIEKIFILLYHVVMVGFTSRVFLIVAGTHLCAV